jgi:hypothetical protein
MTWWCLVQSGLSHTTSSSSPDDAPWKRDRVAKLGRNNSSSSALLPDDSSFINPNQIQCFIAWSGGWNVSDEVVAALQ